ncbi:unnamed protein product [Closterium sp. NIES-53]
MANDRSHLIFPSHSPYTSSCLSPPPSPLSRPPFLSEKQHTATNPYSRSSPPSTIVLLPPLSPFSLTPLVFPYASYPHSLPPLSRRPCLFSSRSSRQQPLPTAGPLLPPQSPFSLTPLVFPYTSYPHFPPVSPIPGDHISPRSSRQQPTSAADPLTSFTFPHVPSPLPSTAHPPFQATISLQEAADSNQPVQPILSLPLPSLMYLPRCPLLLTLPSRRPYLSKKQQTATSPCNEFSSLSSSTIALLFPLLLHYCPSLPSPPPLLPFSSLSSSTIALLFPLLLHYCPSLPSPPLSFFLCFSLLPSLPPLPPIQAAISLQEAADSNQPLQPILSSLLLHPASSSLTPPPLAKVTSSQSHLQPPHLQSQSRTELKSESAPQSQSQPSQDPLVSSLLPRGDDPLIAAIAATLPKSALANGVLTRQQLQERLEGMRARVCQLAMLPPANGGEREGVGGGTGGGTGGGRGAGRGGGEMVEPGLFSQAVAAVAVAFKVKLNQVLRFERRLGNRRQWQ